MNRRTERLKREDSRKLGNRLKFYLEIRKAIKKFVSIDYSVITGGFVQNDEKLGDVDIITVLPHVAVGKRERILEFAKKHVSAQLNNLFSPDFDFPTDVLSKQQIIDAVNGRSLEVVRGNLKLKDYSKEEIVSNPEADYRVWLYEMITHNFDIIAGNFESLVEDTLTALRTIFLLTANLYGYGKKLILDQVRRDLFASAGLSYKLGEKQSRYLLLMLEKERFGKMKTNEILILDTEKITTEIENLKKSVRNKEISSAQHIISWNLLRESIKSLKG